MEKINKNVVELKESELIGVINKASKKLAEDTIKKMKTKKNTVIKLNENQIAEIIKKTARKIVENTINEEGESTNTPIHKFVYFSYNYPNDFIKKVWDGNENLIKHLESKFSNIYDKYGSQQVMFRFYTELSGGNQKELENWIITNYKG